MKKLFLFYFCLNVAIQAQTMLPSDISNIRIEWSPVTTDTAGDPINISGYHVYMPGIIRQTPETFWIENRDIFDSEGWVYIRAESEAGVLGLKSETKYFVFVDSIQPPPIIPPYESDIPMIADYDDMKQWEIREPGIRRSNFIYLDEYRQVKLNGNLGPAFIFRQLNITQDGTYKIKVNWSSTLGTVYCRIDNDLYTFPTDKILNLFMEQGQHKFYIEADNITRLSEENGYIVSVTNLNERVPNATNSITVSGN